MNYKSELQSNNTGLQSILDAVNALPDAGSGGSGGGVETCTVIINNIAATIRGVSLVRYTNGEVTPYVESLDATGTGSLSTPITVPDVICGSAITIAFYSPAMLHSADNAEFLGIAVMAPPSNRCLYYKAPTSSGVTATIEVMDPN